MHEHYDDSNKLLRAQIAQVQPPQSSQGVRTHRVLLQTNVDYSTHVPQGQTSMAGLPTAARFMSPANAPQRNNFIDRRSADVVGKKPLNMTALSHKPAGGQTLDVTSRVVSARHSG